MKETNNVLTVTYPSLYLASNTSIIVTFIGMETADIQRIQALFETNCYENELIFYVSDTAVNEDTVAWANTVSTNSDFIFVNAEKANSTEIAMTLLVGQAFQSIVVTYLALADQDNALTKILKFANMHVIDDIADLEAMITDIIENDFPHDDTDVEDDFPYSK